MDMSFFNYSYEEYDFSNLSSLDNDGDRAYKRSVTDTVLTVLNILTLLFGISLNIAVIVGICRKSYEKSAWEVIFVWYCIQNMSVTADINFSYGFSHWYLPHWMCPMYMFLNQSLIGSTAITVSCLAFISIVFYKDLSKRCLPAEIFLVLFSIVTAAIISIPSAIYSEALTIGISKMNTICVANSVPAYDFATYVLFFFCPVLATIGMTILFSILRRACANSNTRVLIVRVIIAVIYIVCWSPRSLMTFLFSLQQFNDASYDFLILFRVFTWLITLGCCLSALVVLILEPSVRKALCCRRASGNTDETRMELTKN